MCPLKWLNTLERTICMKDNTQHRLIELVSLSKNYCELCETANEYPKEEFIDRVLDLLPRLYWNFFDIQAPGVSLGDFDFFSSYVDQEIYDTIKNKVAAVMSEDDVYLDTFHEDMKYSDTPISASISEGMADIYQPLFDFVQIVHDSEGTQIQDAFVNCKEDFENYWSQNLCNLLKAFNNLKFGN